MEMSILQSPQKLEPCALAYVTIWIIIRNSCRVVGAVLLRGGSLATVLGLASVNSGPVTLGEEPPKNDIPGILHSNIDRPTAYQTDWQTGYLRPWKLLVQGKGTTPRIDA